MIASLCIALIIHQPKWFCTKLSGYDIEKRSDIGIYDSKSGFYLCSTSECDGGYYSLVLTRDRNVVTECGYLVPNFTPREHDNGTVRLHYRPLRSLSTAKGVKIGDTPAEVRLLLGKPSKTERDEFLTYHYKWSDKDSRPDYDQSYVFKAGKLIEIRFDRDEGG
ncbi:MAG TPA: hypothetical protein VHE55_12395 [Fimbriimonadaceae bacterium]|nr:hypothetical protein [Fimbriimonadaceae bacterium]